jgi:hypothetical protein
MADGFPGFLQDNARSHLSNVPFYADLGLNRPIIAEPLRRLESTQADYFCAVAWHLWFIDLPGYRR